MMRVSIFSALCSCCENPLTNSYTFPDICKKCYQEAMRRSNPCYQEKPSDLEHLTPAAESSSS